MTNKQVAMSVEPERALVQEHGSIDKAATYSGMSRNAFRTFCREHNIYARPHRLHVEVKKQVKDGRELEMFMTKTIERFNGRSLPEGYRSGKPATCAVTSQCFIVRNRDREDIDYYEGIMRTPSGVWGGHAWLVDQEGVIDLTWPNNEPQRLEYVGVKFEKSEVGKRILESGTLGLFLSDGERALLQRYLDDNPANGNASNRPSLDFRASSLAGHTPVVVTE